MGFRTNYVSEDLPLALPDWFIERYTSEVHFGRLRDGTTSLPIASKYERKFYTSKEDYLLVDLMRALEEQPDRSLGGLEVCLFHECTGVTKVLVTRSGIRMFEPPTVWTEVEKISHWYCGGCSAKTWTRGGG